MFRDMPDQIRSRALRTRPMLYTNPIAEPRSAVGNSSLAITLKPLK
jgi:hypothetical protein